MSRCMRGVVLLSVTSLMFLSVGCCCFKKKTAAKVPVPAAEAPPEEPAPPPPPPVVQPPPAPEPPPPPPLPPAVTKSIEDLSDKYPGLFRFNKARSLFYFDTDVLFDSGSAVVKPDAKVALGKLSGILNEEGASDRKLTIVGHTDTDRVVKLSTINSLKKLGKPANNMGLSEARAEAVAAVLQAGGVDASRMVTQGKGETQAVADNRTPAGKARNRRVEIYVTPMNYGS
jgi:OOP family OmpA-OmpF porin